MKLTLEDDYLSVNIENKSDGITVSEAREMFVAALVGIGYHESSIAEVMPSEQDINEAIEASIKEALKHMSDSI